VNPPWKNDEAIAVPTFRGVREFRSSAGWGIPAEWSQDDPESILPTKGYHPP